MNKFVDVEILNMFVASSVCIVVRLWHASFENEMKEEKNRLIGWESGKIFDFDPEFQ